MSVNPLIALQSKPGIDVAQSFSNALTNVSNFDKLQQQREQAPIRNRLLEAQASTAEAGVPTDTAQSNQRQLEIFQSLSLAAREVQGNTQEETISKLMNRRNRLSSQGVDTTQTDQSIQLAQEDFPLFQQRANEYIALDDQLNRKQGNKGLFSAKTEFLESGASIQGSPDGNVIVKNPAGVQVEGQERLNILEENRKLKAARLDRAAERTVSTAKAVENVKLRQQRISGIRKEQSTRKRESKRAMVKLNNAFKLADQADQGLTGSAKLQLARVFPGIDVANEGALSAAFKQLSLDQLQQFKGPTTDFEFKVTEDIAGSLGDSKTANKARIASLQRNNWFIGRETDQFNKWTRQGGDPDLFSFNFNEPMKTKKGIFTLQDIQDTAVSNNISIEETLKRLNK